MGIRMITGIGRAVAKFSVGSLCANVGTTLVKRNYITISKNKAVDYALSGIGMTILGDMMANAAADYVEKSINDCFELADDLKEEWKKIADKMEKGDTNGQQISEQQQVSGAAEGGESGGETTSGEAEATEA